MTAQEFQVNVTTFEELFDFCYENGIELFDDVYDGDDADDVIEDQISDRDCGWRTLRDYLNDIPSVYGSCYYRINGFLEVEELGDYDFDWMKSDVYDFAIDRGYFEEEDIEDEYEDEADEEPVEVCSSGDIMSMFAACRDHLISAVEENAMAAGREAEMFVAIFA